MNLLWRARRGRTVKRRPAIPGSKVVPTEFGMKLSGNRAASAGGGLPARAVGFDFMVLIFSGHQRGLRTYDRSMNERRGAASPRLDDWRDPGTPLMLDGLRLPILGTARMYVCGITPYDTTHLGHAATFVWADLAARVLHLNRRPVLVCRNVTDVDDHLLIQAKEQGVSWRSLATQQGYRFERDMEDLGVAHPAFEPRSHDHIDEVIELSQELLTRGWAYARNGSVYFNGAGVHERAHLAREQALVLAAERGGHLDDPNKEDPLDVALWVHSIGDEPAWPSPWGGGRPGWHAECSAMALATFGPAIDLHVGGEDLAFPHHAYEAAQAEAYTGVRPFARAWMHVGSVRVAGTKMAKSTGNLVFVHDVIERWHAAAVRLLILSRKFSDPWDFDETLLDSATGELESLRSLAAKPGGSEAALDEVGRALRKNLDVPRALAVACEAGGNTLSQLIGFLGLHHDVKWW
jgi:cysteinyl-tRNA synthetase